MHLGHVGTPEYEGIGVFQVIVAAHRLIDAEGAHKATYRRGHAVTGIGVDVVRQESSFEQLGSGVTFPDGPLSRTEHADRGGSFLFDCGFELLGHDIEGCIPGDRGEFAFFIIFAIGHPQHRTGQSIFPIHDLGQEVALDAVQPLVDRSIGVALGGYHATLLGPNKDATAGTAKAAGCFVPTNFSVAGFCQQVGCRGGNGNPCCDGRGSNGIAFHERSSG